MSKSFKTFLILFIIIFSIIGIYSFVVTPRRIAGDNVGSYKRGDIVLFISKNLLLLMRPLEKGSVITFNRSDMEMEGVAVIEGVPGDNFDDSIYYFSNEDVGSVVPKNYYAVRLGDNDYLRAVAKEDILWVEWFSLSK